MAICLQSGGSSASEIATVKPDKESCTKMLSTNRVSVPSFEISRPWSLTNPPSRLHDLAHHPDKARTGHALVPDNSMSKTGASRSSVLITMVSNNVPSEVWIKGNQQCIRFTCWNHHGSITNAIPCRGYLIEERLRSPFPVFSMSTHTEVWS